MNDINAVDEPDVPGQPTPPAVSAPRPEHENDSLLESAPGTGSKGSKRPQKRKEEDDRSSLMSDRLRQKSDAFNFDELLSLSSSSSDPVVQEAPLWEPGSAGSANGASQQSPSRAALDSVSVPEVLGSSGDHITQRLVEQLTRTNERLEKLEAALREVSLLAGLQREPVRPDAASPSDTAVSTNELLTGPAAEKANQEAEALFRSGVALCQMKKFNEAVAAWQQVLRLQPDNAYAMANIGIVYTEQTRWTEARDMFARVLRLQPDNAEACFGLGMADAQLGNYTAATAALENTLRLQPDNPDARYNLALVRQRMALNTRVLRPADLADQAETPAINAKSDPPTSISGVNEQGEGQANTENGITSRESEAGQIEPTVYARPLETAGAPTAPVQAARQGDPTALRQGRSGEKRTGLVGLGLSVAAIAAVAGMIFYFQSHAARAPHETGGAPNVAVMTDSPPIHREAVSMPALKPAVNPSSASVEVPQAKNVITSSPPPEVTPPAPVHRITGNRSAAFHVRSSRPHRWTLIKTRFSPKSRFPRRSGQAATPAHANAGFNRGVDRLMDQMH